MLRILLHVAVVLEADFHKAALLFPPTNPPDPACVFLCFLWVSFSLIYTHTDTNIYSHKCCGVEILF